MRLVPLSICERNAPAAPAAPAAPEADFGILEPFSKIRKDSCRVVWKIKQTLL